MKRRICYLLILTCSGICLPAHLKAQQIKAEALLEKRSIMQGDQTVLHLKVTYPPGRTVKFPPLGDTISRNIQIVATTKPDTIKADSSGRMVEVHQDLTITSFEPGSYMIPSLAFKGPSGIVRTDPLLLNVQGVKVDTTKAIYDIKEPIAVSYTLWDWLKDHWIWIVATLFLILIIWGALRFFKKRPVQRVEIKAPQPVLSVQQMALQKLEAIREKKLWEQGMTKEYYSEISDVLRWYLEQQFRIQAQEKTTNEILDSLISRATEQEIRETLRGVLMLADLVKFAKAQPLPEENIRTIERSVQLVELIQKRLDEPKNNEPKYS